MTNGSYGVALIHGVLVPALSDAFGWTTPPGPSPTTAPTTLTRYGDFVIEPANGELWLTYAQQPPIRLSFVDNYWSARDANVDVRFEPGVLIVTQNGVETRASIG